MNCAGLTTARSRWHSLTRAALSKGGRAKSKFSFSARQAPLFLLALSAIQIHLVTSALRPIQRAGARLG